MSVTRAEESAYANRHHQTPLGHPCPATAGGGGGLEFDSLEITGARKKRQEEVGLGQTRRLCPPSFPVGWGAVAGHAAPAWPPPRTPDTKLTRFGRHEEAREPFTKPVHTPANRRWRAGGQVRRMATCRASHADSMATSSMAEPRPPRRVIPVELSRGGPEEAWCPRRCTPIPAPAKGRRPKSWTAVVPYRISSPRHVERHARVHAIAQRRAGYCCSQGASSVSSPMRRIAADRRTCSDTVSRVSMF
jgi:hypothetical protein